MSDEGWVTPSDTMQDIVPKAGNTWFWAKGLSAHGGVGRKPTRAQYLNKLDHKIVSTSQTVNHCSEGCM